MTEALRSAPAVVWVLLAAIVAIIAATLVDVARHDVRHLPKPVWVAIVALVSFPAGVVLYFVLGRVPGRSASRSAAGGSTPLAAPDPAEPGPPPVAFAAAPPPGRRADPAGRPAALATRGLGKTYPDTVALTGVDLTVPRGAAYGLIGPNGAGKTTLLSILAGLRRPTSGTVELAMPRRRLGVLVDTPQFEPWLTAHEVVDLARHLTAPELPGSRVAQALDEVGLAQAGARRVGGFSRGMLQRLGLAACLAGDPEALLLDEPASALDPAGRRDMLDLIGRLSQTKTVLLSTHILADVQQVCDTVGVIDQGRLRFQGPLADLLALTSTVYSLQVRPPLGGLVGVLRQRAWVTEVAELAPGRLRLVVSDAAHAERQIPELLSTHHLALVSFQPATDLETAFLELTG